LVGDRAGRAYSKKNVHLNLETCKSACACPLWVSFLKFGVSFQVCMLLHSLFRPFSFPSFSFDVSVLPPREEYKDLLTCVWIPQQSGGGRLSPFFRHFPFPSQDFDSSPLFELQPGCPLRTCLRAEECYTPTNRLFSKFVFLCFPKNDEERASPLERTPKSCFRNGTQQGLAKFLSKSCPDSQRGIIRTWPRAFHFFIKTCAPRLSQLTSPPPLFSATAPWQTNSNSFFFALGDTSFSPPFFHWLRALSPCARTCVRDL